MSTTALVHDYLSQFGGAERVVLALARTFPDAPLYTSLYQHERTFREFESIDVRTTYLQRLVPEGRFRLAAPFFGGAFEAIDLAGFDRVLISTGGFAHHVNHPHTFVYCHTRPRFIYDLDTYLSSAWLLRGTRPFLPWLRRGDQRAAERHVRYVANSALTARRIEETYRKDVEAIIHPPLAVDHLPLHPRALPTDARALVVARLQPYKRIDIAIEACAKAGVPLTVVGEGIDGERLREMAVGDVTFLGRIGDDRLADLFESHSVVLMPGVEDFGLAPVEANYAGRPALAQAAGGALETIRDGDNGRLVDGTDPGDWADALDGVLHRKWEPAELRDATKPFQLPAFQTAIRQWVNDE